MFHSQIEWINEKEVDSFSLVIQSIRRDSGLSLLLIYLFIHLSIFLFFSDLVSSTNTLEIP